MNDTTLSCLLFFKSSYLTKRTTSILTERSGLSNSPGVGMRPLCLCFYLLPFLEIPFILTDDAQYYAPKLNQIMINIVHVCS